VSQEQALARPAWRGQLPVVLVTKTAGMRLLLLLLLLLAGGSAALPCHHGGPCAGVNATPAHLLPRIHNSPSCLQTSGPHDMAATITLPHEDGGVVHHVFQYCIPCLYSSPEKTCYFKNGNSNPNAANGTWRINNVGDAWQCDTTPAPPPTPPPQWPH
jgi:hypothetical protein